MQRPTWLNWLALGFYLAAAICMAVQCPLDLISTTFGLVLLLTPVLLGVSAYRVRPRTDRPRLFYLLFPPIPAFGLILLAWAAIRFHTLTLRDQPQDSWCDAEELLGGVVGVGTLLLWAWVILLRVYTRRAGMLLLVCGAAAAGLGGFLYLLADALSGWGPTG